jgi:hypothetical protein
MKILPIGTEVICFENKDRTGCVGIGLVESEPSPSNAEVNLYWCVNRKGEPLINYCYFVVECYNDTSLCPFGKHKDQPLESVPADWLMWFYEMCKKEKIYLEGDFRGFKDYELKLYFYIEDNLEAIKKQLNLRSI